MKQTSLIHRSYTFLSIGILKKQRFTDANPWYFQRCCMRNFTTEWRKFLLLLVEPLESHEWKWMICWSKNYKRQTQIEEQQNYTTQNGARNLRSTRKTTQSTNSDKESLKKIWMIILYIRRFHGDGQLWW